jgi:hypothetical protein
MGHCFIILCRILFEPIVSICYFHFSLKCYMKFVIAEDYNSVSVSSILVRCIST